jgi:hypothetical protein
MRRYQGATLDVERTNAKLFQEQIKRLKFEAEALMIKLERENVRLAGSIALTEARQRGYVL